MALLVSILTFLVVTAAFLFIWLFAGTSKGQEVVRQRMEAVRKAERRGGDVALGVGLLRDEMLSGVPFLHRLMLHWSWSTRLRELISQAGLKMRPASLVMLSCATALAAYLVAVHFFHGFVFALLVGLATGTIPIASVAWKRHRRFRNFEEHFPEALDLLGRAVRAGHAFTTGLEMISKEMAQPIAGEFQTAFDEQNFGLPLRDALLNMTERIPLIDVRFFVTALLIQKETGGNLAEILDALARVIRDRFRIYREVRVKTAQGRLTAAILIALPPLMMVMLEIVNPHYISVLFTDPKGPMVLAIAGILQVIGSIMLWKIIHIEV
ncbi:MAG TPA: type II secretion system F family protein [Candidatus Acidoferrales bacterium]|nr:type II secretion system F family protein [Candidatus Acidoferrales bacterium]